MVESAHLHDALTGFFADPRNGWFPPFTEAVAGLTAAQASWIPAEGLNSIWAITNHVHFWYEVVLHQLQKPVDRKALGAKNGWPPPGDPADEASRSPTRPTMPGRSS